MRQRQNSSKRPVDELEPVDLGAQVAGRRYDEASEPLFHVLPGDPRPGSPPSKIAWNALANVDGRLVYYQPIARSKTKVDTFDYARWFDDHLAK